MAENQPLDIEEIVRDSFDENEAEHLTGKLSQLEPEEIAIALEAMPVEQRVSTWLSLHPDDQIAALTYMRVDARDNIFKQPFASFRFQCIFLQMEALVLCTDPAVTYFHTTHP